MPKEEPGLIALRSRAIAARKEMQEVQSLLDRDAKALIDAFTASCDLSLRAAARKLAVSPTYLCSVAKGKSRLTVELLDRMVSVLTEGSATDGGTEAQ